MKSLAELSKTHTIGGKHDLQSTIPPVVKTLVDQVFLQLEFIKPAWKHAWQGKNDDDTAAKINTAKKEWVKSFFENKICTAEQIKRGFIVARSDNSDFIPSCGKFASWCADKTHDKAAKQALANFNRGGEVSSAVEKEVRTRCGHKAKRLSEDKGDKLFIHTYYEVIEDSPELITAVLLRAPTEMELRKEIFNKRDNQKEINKAGIDSLKNLFK